MTDPTAPIPVLPSVSMFTLEFRRSMIERYSEIADVERSLGRREFEAHARRQVLRWEAESDVSLATLLEGL